MAYALLVDAGSIEDPGDLRMAALHVWASVHGLTSLLIAKPGLPWPDLDDLIEEHHKLILANWSKRG